MADGNPKDDVLSLRVSADLSGALKVVADRHGITVSDLVRLGAEDAKKVCASKRKFATRQDAHNAITRLVADGALGDQRQPYLCLACGSWHFGHRIGLGRQRG